MEIAADDAIDLVFDVTLVAGYESAARRAWQSAMWPRRRQIRSMTVISESALTRMGAAMFAKFMRIRCTVVRRGDGLQ